MLNRGFGLRVLDDPSIKALDELLYYAKQTDSILAQLLIMEAYETTFHLYNHDHQNPNEPLALVTMHDQENVVKYSRMANTIRSFRRHRVGHHFHMSLSEFLQYPRHVGRMILEDCGEAEKEEYNRTKTMMENYENGTPKKGWLG